MGWLKKNIINQCHQKMLVLDQYVFSQKRKRKWCENHVSWFMAFLVSIPYACTHSASDLFLLPNATLHLAAGARCWPSGAFQRKEAWDAGIEIASWVKRLHSHTGGGVFLWCWLDWALQREQDGGMDGVGRRGGGGDGDCTGSLLWLTHALLLLSWCPSSLDPPPLSGSLTPAHLLGAVQWVGGFSVPSPHHMHTQPCTLSLKFSHSHCCISRLTVNHSVLRARALV